MTHPGSPPSDPDRDAIYREIAELNEQIRTQSFNLVEPVAFPPDLTMRQLQVLLAAAVTEGVTVHQVATELGISAPTASGLVDRLVDKCLITKIEDPNDRRVRHIHVNTDGQAILSQLDSAFDRLLDEMLALLGPDELTIFRDNSQFTLRMIDRLRMSRDTDSEA